MVKPPPSTLSLRLWLGFRILGCIPPFNLALSIRLVTAQFNSCSEVLTRERVFHAHRALRSAPWVWIQICLHFLRFWKGRGRNERRRSRRAAGVLKGYLWGFWKETLKISVLQKEFEFKFKYSLYFLLFRKCTSKGDLRLCTAIFWLKYALKGGKGRENMLWKVGTCSGSFTKEPFSLLGQCQICLYKKRVFCWLKGDLSLPSG